MEYYSYICVMDKLFKHKDISKDVKFDDFNFSEDTMMVSKKGDNYWLTFGMNPQFSYLYEIKEEMEHDRDLLIEMESDK